ncbi:MAG TPA: ABC transporter permease [Acidimicrobiales bacterium]
MRLLRLLALRHVRRRPLRAALAVVAVAAGTALAVNVFVVRSSVARSVEDFGRSLAGPAELRVVGAVRRGGLEPSVVEAVARTEGVAAVVPVVQAVTVVEVYDLDAEGSEATPAPSPGDAEQAAAERAAPAAAVAARAERAAAGAEGAAGVRAERAAAGVEGAAGVRAERAVAGVEGAAGVRAERAADAGPADVAARADDDGDPVEPEEKPVLVLGVDCRAEALVGPFGCEDLMAEALTRRDQPAAVGPGVDRRGRLATRRGTVLLGEVPRAAALAGIGEGAVVVFPLETAQRLFDRGDRFDVAYVEPERGADVDALRERLTEVVGEQNGVLDAGQGPPEIGQALGEVLPLFTLLALFALGVGGMLVYNTVLLALEERRRDLAIVGALGGTQATVAGATLGEAAVTGAAGGVLGAAAATAVAGPIVTSLSTFTERSAGVPLEVHVTPATVALGVVLGMTVSVLAAVLPVRRALRIDIAVELSGRHQRAERGSRALSRRVALGVAVGAAGLVAVALGNRDGGLEPWQVPAAGAGFGATAVGVIILAAALAPAVVRPLARLAGDRAPARLAVTSLVRDPRRTGVMTAAVTAALGTAFVTAGYSSGLRLALAEDADDDRGVEVAAVSVGANANLDAGLAPGVLDRLAELPGVRSVDERTNVSVGTRRSDLVRVFAAEDPAIADGERLLRGTFDAAAFAEGEALISRALARDEGLRPGDAVRLPTPTGVVELPVQAVFGGGATGRFVQIPWDLHRTLFGPQPVRSVVLRPDPGTTPEELARTVRAADLGASVRVRTPDQLGEALAESAEREIEPFWALQRGLMAVSFVAVLSTLLLVGVQRRREMGLLGALGMAPGSLGRMVLTEAGAVTLAAVALSVVGGLVMLWALLEIAPLLIGYDPPFRPDWSSLAGAGAVALAVTLAGALWPAVRALRTDVVAALQDE